MVEQASFSASPKTPNGTSSPNFNNGEFKNEPFLELFRAKFPFAVRCSHVVGIISIFIKFDIAYVT